jgi:hypothetical protein
LPCSTRQASRLTIYRKLGQSQEPCRTNLDHDASIVNNTGAPYFRYTNNAEASVTKMYKAGVPILVGTDANTSPFLPANPPFGLSYHEELALLIAGGLSPVDAIIGGTSLAASDYQLYDSDSIAVGMRADLVLLSADPTVDIRIRGRSRGFWLEVLRRILLLDGDAIPSRCCIKSRIRTEFTLDRYLSISSCGERVCKKRKAYHFAHTSILNAIDHSTSESDFMDSCHNHYQLREPSNACVRLNGQSTMDVEN